MNPLGTKAMSPEARGVWLDKITKHGAWVGNRECPEHYIWRSMIRRCDSKKDRSFRYYGARGIRVCEEWYDYEVFLEDMGKRPTPDHSLDRVDVNGNYEPANCRWATRSEQQKNKVGTRRWEQNGEILTLSEWAEKLGISRALALWRIKTWGTFEKGKTWLLQNTK